MGSRPLLVGITDLVRQPGTRRPLQRSVALDGLAISTAAVPDDGEIEVDLVIEALSNGVVCTGTVTVPWVGECRRCLNDVVGTSTADVREIFERRPTEGETYPMGDDVVDLEPMVRDAALLLLPMAPLCSEGCLGPAPDNFPARVEDEPRAAGTDGDEEAIEADDDEGASARDPRWAALDQLKFD